MSRSLVAWSDQLLRYDLGDHPLSPVRVELTMALARELGVLDRPGVEVVEPAPADDATLGLVHHADYIAAVKAAPDDPFFMGWGLGTGDNPIIEGMHETSALIVGATVLAAESVWSGRAERAINIAGGLHHAMPQRAAGFCVYNDPAVAIARLLDLGAQRVAYVDIDVHHGDGVERIFWDDPRVLTVSLHETPLALFPGTGFPHDIGGGNAQGSAVNVALPPGTDDGGWLRAFEAVVPSVLRSFAPQLIVAQCGADSHRLDPLADLRLSVDGHRASYLRLRELADELCDGRWVALGGGGYALVEVVPRSWAHLLAIVTGIELPAQTVVPQAWRSLAERKVGARVQLLSDGTGIPTSLSDGAPATFRPWHGDDPADAVDRAIVATRRAVFPLHGLDPYDPRD